MPRILKLLLILIPALWLSIQVFGWIVSGDMKIAAYNLKRDDQPLKFWVQIVAFSLVCCGLFIFALGVFDGRI